MINLSEKLRLDLIAKQKEVDEKLKKLDEEESSLSQATPESQELGTYSWQADIQSTKVAIRKQLLDFSEKIQLTLLKLKQGTYGMCDKCKKQIDAARLKIMPIANLCTVCVN